MTSPATLLKAWDILARKEFGQNFIREPSLAGQIVTFSGLDSNDVVLDIGAGLGAMTIAAARVAKSVIAVERDVRIIPLLRAELLVHGLRNVKVLTQNILSLDLKHLARSEGKPFIVFGNLPYNISSQVLIKLIKERSGIRRAILMFQKELAQRLCAGPGNRTYGRLSVMLQYCADIKSLREVRADMFFPKPKIDSVVLSIDFKTEIPHQVTDEVLMSRVVKAAFGQRRKTLRNALSAGLVDLEAQTLSQIFTEIGIESRRRAETLSVEEFVALTNGIDRHLNPVNRKPFHK